jgi:uncharacterized protein (TIGR00725 family)
MRLTLDRAAGRLAAGGLALNLDTRTWAPAGGSSGGGEIGLAEAARWLQRDSGRPCRLPVAVVGPRVATAGQVAVAEAVGRALAGLGVIVLCGGREGVMEAACRGAAAGGGTSVGLLPEEDARHANPYVTIPIATGIGEARNALIARAALCLAAVGSSYGTISEVALALRFGKPVFGLAGAPALEGVVTLRDAADLEAAVARVLLGLPPGEAGSGGR